MAISWTTLQAAIHAWVVAGSGLVAGKVIFEEQNGNRPAEPFVGITFGTLAPLGLDELTHVYNAGGAAGAEITQTVRGMRTLVVRLQCYADPIGANAAHATLSKVQAALALPTVKDALVVAGLGLAGMGSVVPLGKVLGTTWKGRAVLDVSFNVSETVSATTTFIEIVEHAGTVYPPGESGPPL